MCGAEWIRARFIQYTLHYIRQDGDYRQYTVPYRFNHIFTTTTTTTYGRQHAIVRCIPAQSCRFYISAVLWGRSSLVLWNDCQRTVLCFFLTAERSRFFVSFCRKQKEISLVLSKAKEQPWRRLSPNGPAVRWFLFGSFWKCRKNEKKRKGTRPSMDDYSITHTEYLCFLSSLSPKSRPKASLISETRTTWSQTRPNTSGPEDA